MNSSSRIYVFIRLIALAAIIGSLVSSASAEWKEKVLYSFQGGTDGQLPSGGLIFDKSGNLYGVTSEGGGTSCPPGWCGTVYKLSPPAQEGEAWTETVIYVFKGHDQNDGSSPSGSLVADHDGNFYGTTAYGGSGPCELLGGTGCGTVYELSPPSNPGDPWTEKVLYSFQGGNDGDLPIGSLVFDKQGNLYGATYFGGGQGTTCDAFYGGNCGTIFELSPPQSKDGQWTEKVLHSFGGGTDGALPNGGLVLDSEGAVYGTTFYGGDEKGECDGGETGIGCGTVFKLAGSGENGRHWTEELIHVFKDGSDGSWPSAGLTLDPAGYLYGATIGTVFRLTPLASGTGQWKEEILHEFNSQVWGPQGALILDRAGNLLGTTYSAQKYGGTVFQLTKPDCVEEKWTFDLLYGFSGGGDGGQPAASLIPSGDGGLYSTTQNGGSGTACGFAGCGTVFEVIP
jgi:hypothetical protein